jgi:hypothetical protein
MNAHPPKTGAADADILGLVLGDIEALVGSWPEVRDDPTLAGPEALRLLATWAHLRRLPPEGVPASLAEQLNRLIQAEQEGLLRHFLATPLPGRWGAAFDKLDQGWESAATPEQANALESLARDLFDTLDQDSLAAYTAASLLPQADERRQSGLAAVQQWLQQVAGLVGSTGQRVLADRPRDHRHSWVVNARTERPTGYSDSEMDPTLLRSIREHGSFRAPRTSRSG